MRFANFIIAGTEKAGTTSVFSYLAGHPEVAASRHKETDFFRTADGDPQDYARHFAAAGNERIRLEASPGYLGEAAQVAPRIHALIPDVKLLFILREPMDRFLSSYHFHHARLNLPAELDLHDYLGLCMDYVEGRGAPATGPVLDEWFLKVLPFGRYASYLQHFFTLFPREQIRVAFLDDLRASPARFMCELSDFIGIDTDFWNTADFAPRNVTFSARRRWLHRIAIRTNDGLESFLRPRPALKAQLLGLYGRLNGAQDDERRLSASDRQSLERFYAPANRELATLLATQLPVAWSTGQPSAQSRANPPPRLMVTSG